MPLIAKLIGGAGTGKTHRQLETMEKVLRTGVPLEKIGFVSFTRAARREAAERAAGIFDTSTTYLEDDGWFRTLHSVCYRCLDRPDGLLVEDKESREWLQNALQCDVESEGVPDQPFLETAVKDDPVHRALNLWHAARNRMCSLQDEWERDCQTSIDPLHWETALRTVKRYEQAKAVDNRCDFTDLLARFTGTWWFNPEHPPSSADPQGWLPPVEVWFLDEAQDLSALSAKVFERVLSVPICKWAYLGGDPFQAIYGFAGASPRPFMEWRAEKEEIMARSHRCGAEILALGESILRACSNYIDRDIAPSGEACSLTEHFGANGILSQVDPTEPWLFLARTNYHARRLAARLEREGVPWQPTRGFGGWNKPARNEALTAMLRLQQGYPIEAKEWKRILEFVPSTQEGKSIIRHGVKTKWRDGFQPSNPCIKLEEIRNWGASERFENMLREGDWTTLVDGASQWVRGEARYGWEIATNPKVKVGTIHSAKGAEADNVCVLSTTTMQVELNKKTAEGADEERRVSYVAVTRAKKSLHILKEPRKGRLKEMDIV